MEGTKEIHMGTNFLVQGLEEEALPKGRHIGEFFQSGVLGIVLVAAACQRSCGLVACMGLGLTFPISPTVLHSILRDSLKLSSGIHLGVSSC